MDETPGTTASRRGSRRSSERESTREDVPEPTRRRAETTSTGVTARARAGARTTPRHRVRATTLIVLVAVACAEPNEVITDPQRVFPWGDQTLVLDARGRPWELDPATGRATRALRRFEHLLSIAPDAQAALGIHRGRLAVDWRGELDHPPLPADTATPELLGSPGLLVVVGDGRPVAWKRPGTLWSSIPNSLFESAKPYLLAPGVTLRWQVMADLLWAIAVEGEFGTFAVALDPETGATTGPIELWSFPAHDVVARGLTMVLVYRSEYRAFPPLSLHARLVPHLGPERSTTAEHDDADCDLFAIDERGRLSSYLRGVGVFRGRGRESEQLVATPRNEPELLSMAATAEHLVMVLEGQKLRIDHVP